jgi:hypothetical protein
MFSGLKGNKLEAAKAIAAANPTWSVRHVQMCADYLMPTSTAWCFEPGTKERQAAEELHKERMHAFLVEMNIIPAEAAFKRPENWQSPYTNSTPRAHRTARAPAKPPAPSGAAPVGSTAPATTSAPRPVGAPAAGTSSGRIWAVCSDMLASLGRMPTSAEVKADQRLAGLNSSTVGTQFSHWRRFTEGQK